MNFSAIVKEYRASIKSPDTEEKLDLILYRPPGFIIAKISYFLGLTPTILTLTGMVFGFLAAWFFLDANNISSLVVATLLFVLSGIFDSSDGQLARISGQSSRFGMMLDGFCDSMVMIVIYIAASLPFLQQYGWPFAILLVGSLLLHSSQSSLLDFYHREYLYFGYGKIEDDACWNPTIDEAREDINQSSGTVEIIFRKLYLIWVRQQQVLTTRKNSIRYLMRAILLGTDEDKKQRLKQAYRKYNLPLLPYWRLLGPNFHSIMMVVFIFLHRFDLYLLLVDFAVLNLVVIFTGIIQRRQDDKMLQELGVKTV